MRQVSEWPVQDGYSRCAHVRSTATGYTKLCDCEELWPLNKIRFTTASRVHDVDGTYGVILRIVKAGSHLVAIAQVVEH